MHKQWIALMVAALCVCGCQTSSKEESIDFSKLRLDESSVISEKEMTITMMSYYGGEDDVLHNYACEKVYERFPNVKIEIENSLSDGGATIRSRAASGMLPDLLKVDSGVTMYLAESGSIYTLDTYAQEMGLQEYMVQGAVQTCLTSADGHIYGFPLGGVTPVIWFYNKRIFAENNIAVPNDFNSLLEATDALTKAGILPCAVFANEPWPNGAIFESFVMPYEPKGIYALSLGEAYMSDEIYTNAVYRLKRLIDAGFFQATAAIDNFETAASVFENGECAMFIDGAWYLNDAEKRLGDDLGILPFYPTTEGANDPAYHYAMIGGGDPCGIAVTKNAKDPELCAAVAAVYAYYREVAEYTIEKDVTIPYDTTNMIPVEPFSHTVEELIDVLPLMTYKSKYVHNLENVQFRDAFTIAMQRLLSGDSAENFIQNIDKVIEETCGRQKD